MVKIPNFIRWFFPSVLWRVSALEKIIYLTFDDGPTPEVTSKVLAILKKHEAKATFFCLGNKVKEYPVLFQEIIKAGHSVGNHSYSHYLGWNTSNRRYFKDVEMAEGFIKSSLFRPPYGKMKLSQYRHLKNKYKVVLWDVIPGDYKSSMTTDKLIGNVLNNVSNGSVVVLHDSEKCSKVMLEALPVILNELKKQGYRFKSIQDE